MYMKSLLLLVWLSILLSIACSNYKSEDSQLRANNDGTTKPISGTGTASAQEKPHCALTLAAAPAIEGLKLGMSSDEVFALKDLEAGKKLKDRRAKARAAASPTP